MIRFSKQSQAKSSLVTRERQFLEVTEECRSDLRPCQKIRQTGLPHTYATFALEAGRDIHKLALQMGTTVAMREKFYSNVSPRMNAAAHARKLKHSKY